MWNDVVFAVRLLRRERTLSIITLASVTLAVGLTTALFGVLTAVGQPASGIRDPERVFAIERSKERGSFRGWNYQELATLETAQSIGVVATLNQSGSLGETRNEPSAARLPFAAVSGAYFDQLGGRSVVGRLLRPDDDRPGAVPVVVLSHGLWQHGFSGDSSIVGRTAWLGNVPVTVAGVVDRGFSGPGDRAAAPPAFWVALASYGESTKLDRADQSDRIREQMRLLEGDHNAEAVARRREFEATLARLQGPWNANVDVYGRLAPAATEGRAESELTAAAAALLRAHGDEAGAAGIDVNLSDLASRSTGGDSRAMTRMAMSILVMVLLVACVNVSNVLFAGAIRRRREIGTRLALGASRWRVVRQLLTESCVLGGIGGVAALWLATWLAPLLGRLLDVPVQIDLSLDRRGYEFAALSTMAAAIGAGLVPALYGRSGELLAALKATASSGGGAVPAGRLRAILIGGQTTAVVLLLVSAALLTRTLAHVATVEVGFAADQLMSVRLSLGRDYDAVRRRQFWEAAIERIRQIPGIQAAALAGNGPMEGGTVATSIAAAPSDAGTDALGGSLQQFHRNSTTADYFRTIGLPLLRGRSYTDEEVRNSAPVAVISQSLARAAWGDADPIGSSMERVWGRDDAVDAKRMGFLSKPAGTRVIGVVGDTVTRFMRPQTAMIYMPMDSTIYGPLLVRASNPVAAATSVQEALRALEPTVQPQVTFISENLREELRLPRSLAMLALLLGLTALVLAVVGLFGITAVVVDLRRHEVSVRMALGATGRAVVGLLMRDCLKPVAIGAVVGLVIAPIGARLLRVILFGVSPYDPWAILSAVLVLVVTAATAVFIPTRRASRIDPMTVLKTE